ncbi:TIGR00180 family glycosyltransferase [Silvimonas sp.]|uniref:TIGR00180 family glycosyltransferase n=1 Tax=Silvimonas sp. TaxID=2650811 RepID=UPI002843ED6E|nr:TIGR00180 family glycosyltransferase [Silvimonas sp.]MDR3429058.1 TIGR00180 family glycosyltransferase [Silvimonas sp.]
MNQFGQLLTLVLLTHNRPQFLARAIRYYSAMPCTLLIMDSSAESNIWAVEQYGNERTSYQHCGDCDYSQIMLKIRRGTNLVTTPYMAFVTDDDFTLEGGLVQGLDFLQANPDYALCHGYCLMYLADGERVHYFLRDRKVVEDYAGASEDRIMSFMDNFIPPFYAIARSTVFKDWFDLIPDDIRWEYNEFGEALYKLARGKARILPIPFVVRELNYPVSDHQTDLYQALTDPRFDGPQKEAFFDFMANIYRKLEPTVSFYDARIMTKKAAAVLALCLGSNKSLTVQEIFRSEWRTITPRPDWFFEIKQFVEMPFYNAEFFALLEEIDLLLRAMPCGKLQLKELEPKLQWQNQLIVQGIASMDAGDAKSAQQAFEAILSQNPFHINTICSLCVLHANAGALPLAKVLLDWAKRLNPQDPAVRSLEPLGRAIEQQTISVKDMGSTRRLAVVVHLFYPDLWPEFARALSTIDHAFDLIVTTPEELLQTVVKLIKPQFPNARVYPVTNRGRDIAPLFKLLEHEKLEDFDLVLKIHSKKSAHLRDGVGEAWRTQLLAGLLPADGIGQVLAWFDTHPTGGMLSVSGTMLNAYKISGAHRENLPGMRQWAKRIGVDPQNFDYDFIAGSMYWARGALFGALRRLGIRQEDFEEETGQLDGTLAHVFERLMPLVAKSVGLETGQLSGVPVKPIYKDAVKVGANAPTEIANSHLEKVAQAGPVISVYEDWLQQRSLSLPEARMIDTRVDQLPPQIARFYLIDRMGNMPGVSETLTTLGQQYFKDKQAAIVSPLVDPEPNSGVAWFQSADGYVAAMADVAQVQADWVGLVEVGDRLTLDGLLLGLLQAADNPQWQVIYWDDDWIGDQGTPDMPRFKPDFSPDLMRAMPYADGMLLVRHGALKAVLAAGPLEPGAEQIDLLLRLYEQFGEKAIGHVPTIGCHLAQLPWRSLDDHGRAGAFARAVRNHLARINCPATLSEGLIPGTLNVQYQHATTPLVSIIVPTKDQFAMLSRCVESVLERTRYAQFELLIVDNNTTELDAVNYLDGLEKLGNPRIRVIRYPHPFNFSAINNYAVEQAHGEYVVLLNNDTAIIQENWLEELVRHAQRPEVGAVGARLLYPDGKIQHAGVVLGLRGPADHPFIGLPRDERGYMNRLQVIQNYSVVTAACLIIRKSIYRELGGMDEQDFKVSYNDVDLCLKVRQAGYLIVWTPFATVLHEGSVSQTRVDPAAQEAKRKRFAGEQEAMFGKWLPQLATDPYYNRNLMLHGNGFEIENRRLVSFQPISWKPPLRVLTHPADQMGCGHYRMIQPFQALKGAQKLSGAISFELLGVIDQERFKPDVLIFQRQITAEQIEFMARAKRLSGAYCIYELDDYLPNIPLKSAHRDHMPKDVLKSLRRAVAHVDRFVVSTERLAEQYADLHDNFHVVHNYLPESWWGNLPLIQTEHARPRVGWAGGISHTGDLELIEGVVRELANEVDWVFFGMCPPKLRPYIKELHEGVPIEGYPAKLASLQLDLALAPLEHNQFNESKSNLRLLEYGACGFPVVCTDIEPYRVDLPVTRVRNRHKDWIDAIRMHLDDLSATRQRGMELRNAVHDKWMLKGDNLELWRKAWSPD